MYRVKIYTEDEVFVDAELTKNELEISLKKELIRFKRATPEYIMSDVKKSNGASCWCGTEGYGYKIALITEDKKHLNYYFS
jgi:hypothetical protein